jgi:hypothetical protein
MLKFFARPFVILGERIQDIHAILIFKDDDKPLDDDAAKDLKGHLENVLKVCEDLGLDVSKELFEQAKDSPPATDREFDVMKTALYAELKNRLMVYVPSHRRKYFQHKTFLDPGIQKPFPGAFTELGTAGQAFSVGLYTATVFHAMRAVELGLRSMAQSLEVELPNLSLENVDWETLIRQIESKIEKMKDLPRN